jgi:hypothetical protein
MNRKSYKILSSIGILFCIGLIISAYFSLVDADLNLALAVLIAIYVLIIAIARIIYKRKYKD